MNRFFKALTVFVVALFAAGVTFVITYTEMEKRQEVTVNYVVETSALSEKVNEIAKYINRYFVGDADEQTINDAISAAMIASLGDRWSYYISAADWESYMEGMNNAYVGIGVTIQQPQEGEEEKGYEIVSVTAGGPAEQAGLVVGDCIIAADGETAVGMDLDTLKERVKGPEGTQVTLTVRHADGTEEDIVVTRATVDTVVVSYELLESGAGLITIENFDANCADRAIAAIEDLVEQGATALIFDVRNNPGGMKTELVKLLDYLLPEGTLFQSIDYRGKETTDTSDAACIEMPMAVLINENSYSAAEFFAAALREYDWAVLVGAQTSGKGYYQNTFQLSDGSAIAISTGQYFTPKGESLAGVGLTPDYPVELSEEAFWNLYYDRLPREEDAQLIAALEALNLGD